MGPHVPRAVESFPVFPCAGQEEKTCGHEEIKTPIFPLPWGVEVVRGPVLGVWLVEQFLGNLILQHQALDKDWRWNCPSVALEPLSVCPKSKE